MKKTRPVNLDIATMKLPITAYASILHRISGVFLLVGIALLLWMLDVSLSGPEGFEQIKECLASPLATAALWVVLVGLGYHGIAGVRHLLMDAGIGESLEGGVLGAKIVIVLAILFAIAIGVWLWV